MENLFSNWMIKAIIQNDLRLPPNRFMNKLIFILVSLFCFSTAYQPAEAANSKNRLTGSVVKGIVERFVAIHYSQKPLDDSISKKIFKLYLNRLVPGHYYFLEEDIREFQKYETRLDDMLLSLIHI